MQPVAYLVAYAIFWVLFVGPAVMIAVLVGTLEIRLHPKAYGAVLLGIAGITAASWLASRAARRLAYDRELFLVAARGALVEGRTRLSFLPLIGHWFER